MARIVVNKHIDRAELISNDMFNHDLGEIIICNEVDNEGLFIKNRLGEIVKINSHGGSSSGGTSPDDIMLLREMIRNISANTYTKNEVYTKEETNEVISSSLSGYSSDQIENILSRLEELESHSGTTQRDDHHVMTYSQYMELLNNNFVVIDGKTITYNDNDFYLIYNGSDTPVPVYPDGYGELDDDNAFMFGNDVVETPGNDGYELIIDDDFMVIDDGEITIDLDSVSGQTDDGGDDTTTEQEIDITDDGNEVVMTFNEPNIIETVDGGIELTFDNVSVNDEEITI